MSEYAWVISPIVTLIGLAVAVGVSKGTINDLVSSKQSHSESIKEFTTFMHSTKVSMRDEAVRLNTAFTKLDKKREDIAQLRRDVDQKITAKDARDEFASREMLIALEKQFTQRIDSVDAQISKTHALVEKIHDKMMNS